MVSVKVSISLPEYLLKKVDEAAKAAGISRSELIARILEEKFGKEEKVSRYPTVLWKMRVTHVLKFRSPRYPGRRILGKWVIEEVEEKREY